MRLMDIVWTLVLAIMVCLLLRSHTDQHNQIMQLQDQANKLELRLAPVYLIPQKQRALMKPKEHK